MKYSNVLIEKEDAARIEVEFKDYPVIVNHSPTVENLVGLATVQREKTGELTATIRTFGNRNIKGLFPSVGIQIIERERLTDSFLPGRWSKGKLLAIGITDVENQDPTIPPIGEPDKE